MSVYTLVACVVILAISDEDYNKATLVSTTSSKTDEGSRSQTLKRGVHMVPGYSCNHQNMQENPNQLGKTGTMIMHMIHIS